MGYRHSHRTQGIWRRTGEHLPEDVCARYGTVDRPDASVSQIDEGENPLSASCQSAKPNEKITNFAFMVCRRWLSRFDTDPTFPKVRPRTTIIIPKQTPPSNRSFAQH